MENLTKNKFLELFNKLVSLPENLAIVQIHLKVLKIQSNLKSLNNLTKKQMKLKETSEKN